MEKFSNLIKDKDLNFWLLTILLITHCNYMLVFFITGLYEMAYFNIYSVLSYVFTIYLYNKGRETLAFALAFVEIVLHQALGIWYVGFNSGFVIVYTCLFFLQCTFFRNWKVRCFITILLIVGIFVSYEYTEYYGLKYSYLEGFFFRFNTVASVAFMILYGTLATLVPNKKIVDLTNMIYRDFLTGLYNRKYFNEKVLNTFSGDSSILIAICDIDNFKNLNDKFGHDIGDLVLKMVSSTLLYEVSELNGVVVRWGGEEFLIKIDVSNEDDALKYLQNIRIAVDSQSFKQFNISPTITIGGAFIQNPDKLFFDKYFKIADNELYAGKNSGKNTVKIKIA